MSVARAIEVSRMTGAEEDLPTGDWFGDDDGPATPTRADLEEIPTGDWFDTMDRVPLDPSGEGRNTDPFVWGEGRGPDREK